MNPNFLVAGVAKCGTTSLFYYLIQHPEVCIPKKETFYFVREFYNQQTDDPIGRRKPEQLILSREAYDNLYAKCNTKAIGEVSTCYFHFPDMAIPEIKKLLGEPKIILMFRNPVERAWSNYKHFAKINQETLSFKDAIAAADSRRLLHWDFMWDYTALGFYAKQLKRYKHEFKNVHIIFNEDLENNPEETMKLLFKFLEIDDTFIPNTKTRYNISDTQHKNFWFKYVLKNNFVRTIIRPVALKIFTPVTRQKFRHKLRKSNKEQESAMPMDIRKELAELYKSDIIELQQETGRDLTAWLNS